ncbi:hypothetical protein [Ancylobacter mangrovi]|uniref:hypothetical protein n=1 Tax=Ancylobacter mangrovi TaxID=2972472 RepID=UPI0021633833|nr:hypothetical protein [Ancylobacter mangrovi]MCS0504639.1 hypothetical protein [Ancylobacter mangrovi]
MTRSPVPPARARRWPLRAGLLFLLRLLLAIIILADELFRPFYRPLIDRLAALRLMRAFERWVGARSPFTILVLLAIPYLTVEPFKFIALIWIADGAVRTGTLALVLAYLISFVVVERIFTAGRPKLMTIAWMAWLIETATAVQRQLFAWLRIDLIKQETLRQLRRLRASLR